MLAAINADLVRAIRDRRLVEFVYKDGRQRMVEPHDYGMRHGLQFLLGYQITGDSRSSSGHGWKQFSVADIDRLRILDRTFPGTRVDSKQHHRVWDTLFARVT